MRNTQKGLTLVALIVTIIVLIILAGVSINLILGDNGIITKAVQAKEEVRYSTIKEQVELWQAGNEIGEKNITAKDKKELIEQMKQQGLISEEEEQIIYTTGKLTVSDNEVDFWKLSINDIVKVGDYIDYKQVESEYTPSDIPGSTTGKITTEKDIKWRYFGQDEEGNAILISNKNTNTKITLIGAAGYSNIVNILDGACEKLYNSDFAQQVRGMKTEDLEKVLNYNKTKFVGNTGIKYGDIRKYTGKYPYVFEKEEDGKIDGVPTTGKIKSSDKNDIETLAGASEEDKNLEIKQIYWTLEMKETDFIDSKSKVKYFDLICKNGNSNLNFAFSSRGNILEATVATWSLPNIYGNGIKGDIGIYKTTGAENKVEASFRPMVILKSNIEVTGGKGTENEPYTINLY